MSAPAGLMPCPFCRTAPIGPLGAPVAGFRYGCPECGTLGPEGLTVEQAIAAWNRRTSIADRVPEGWGLASIERNSEEDGWVAELWGPYESAKGSLVVEGTGATIEDAVESAVRAIDSTP